MQQSVPTSEKSTALVLGFFLLGAGFVCFLLNFSLLPVFGAIIGIPCMLAGVFFLVRHKKRLGR